jgi:hypothetical protein
MTGRPLESKSSLAHSRGIGVVGPKLAEDKFAERFCPNMAVLPNNKQTYSRAKARANFVFIVGYRLSDRNLNLPESSFAVMLYPRSSIGIYGEG